MPAYLDSTNLQDHYLGSTPINSLWFGEDNIWTRSVAPPFTPTITIGGYTESQAELQKKFFDGLFNPAGTGGSLIVSHSIVGGNTIAVTSGNYTISTGPFFYGLAPGDSFSGDTTITSFIDSGNCTAIWQNNVTGPGQLSGPFENCVNLTQVEFPGVTSLGIGIFRNTGLTEISLPELLNIEGANAFRDCANLTVVNFPKITKFGGVPGTYYNVFTDVPDGGTITVPIAMATNNGGNPDATIQYLQGKSWTINYI